MTEVLAIAKWATEQLFSRGNSPLLAVTALAPVNSGPFWQKLQDARDTYIHNKSISSQCCSSTERNRGNGRQKQRRAEKGKVPLKQRTSQATLEETLSSIAPPKGLHTFLMLPSSAISLLAFFVLDFLPFLSFLFLSSVIATTSEGELKTRGYQGRQFRL